MIELPLQRSFRKAVGAFELGKPYRIHRSFMSTTYTKDCMLIMTGGKGFNFLGLANFKCMFPRPLYQVNSAKKVVHKGQKIFNIELPDYIDKVEVLDDTAPIKYVDTEDIAIEAARKAEIKKKIKEEEERKIRESKVVHTKGALYRMEIL